MEINLVNSINNSGVYTQSVGVETGKTDQSKDGTKVENIAKAVTNNTNLDNKMDKQENEKDKKELSVDAAHQISKEMNKFMRLLDSNIRFKIHEKTNTLIVQVVDSTDNTVLKEFPPHELLDTKAKIREYVGILLDRHA